MMARNFRPHTMMPWATASAAAPHDAPAKAEPNPEDDADKKPATDSDNETASAASSDKDTAAPALPAAGVASSFARAGKLLWGGKNPLSGLAALKKQHSRTVSDFSESDFTTPFAPGTPIWTRYGLGTIVTTRADDGFLIVTLQGLSRMTLFLNPADEDYYSVPAIRHDWVETPAGEGRVVDFDAKMQTYSVRIGGDSGRNNDVDVNVHRSDLRRVMPVRRQTHAPLHAQTQQPQPHQQPQTPAQPQEPNAIAKGLNTALKTLATTSSGLSTSTYQFVSNFYYHGQFVITTFGSGTIIALDQTNHRAQVQLTYGAMAYLSTDAILHYAKALEGMEVTTKFGAGVVTEVRGADSMYGVKLHAPKDGEPEIVFVHESDVARGAARRLRLGSAQKNISEKIGASTTKLFSFAQNKVKLFGQNASAKTSMSPTPKSASPSPARQSPVRASPAAPSRSKSTRVVESDDEVSSAGI